VGGCHVTKTARESISVAHFIPLLRNSNEARLIAMRPPLRRSTATPGVRPEDARGGVGDADAYYDPATTKAYTKVNVQTQRELTSHAIELLGLGAGGGGSGGGGGGGCGALLADVGCGSGLSGVEIARRGHAWVGVDASAAMLDQAVSSGGGGGGGQQQQQQQQAQDGTRSARTPNTSSSDASSSSSSSRGSVALVDFSQGLPFRRDAFDGCVSISAAQWLCVGTPAHAREKLLRFFTAVARCMKPAGPYSSPTF